MAQYNAKWLLSVARHAFLRCTKALFNWPGVYDELEYRSAYEYKGKYVPKDGTDYEWVGEYAQFNFKQLLSTNKALDAKADSLIRVFASGGGLLSIGAILTLSKVSFAVAVLWGIAHGFSSCLPNSR